MNFITTITDRDTWFFRSSTWFNQIHVDGLSGTDGAIYLNGVNLYNILSYVLLMVLKVGIEPTTYRLRDDCSTN